MIDSRIKTYEHINAVQKILNDFICRLQRRLLNHDQSKLISPEKELFDEYTPILDSLEYGTPEYLENLKNIKPALDHHYLVNSHHPEHAYYDEVWTVIKGYEGRYEISSYGRVKRLERIAKRDGDKGDLKVSSKILRLSPTPKGYLRVALRSDDESSRNFMVHRLVANAFLQNEDNRPQVNHLDGDKANNHVSNLEWATTSENLLHAYDTELRQPNAKYFVHCIELDLITCGTLKMERKLRDLGYERASAAGIYSAMDEEGRKHLDLTFVGYDIDKGHPQSMVRKMTVIDLVEMLADWRAATARTKNGDILKSIEFNQARFGYSDELKEIMLNTMKLFENQ